MSVKWGGEETAEQMEYERQKRHVAFAQRMLVGLESMQALAVWTTDAVRLVDELPETWPADNEYESAQWDRLRLMVRALFGLARSGQLEPTRRREQ